jgi:hypothetical protein
LIMSVALGATPLPTLPTPVVGVVDALEGVGRVSFICCSCRKG